MLRFVLKFWLFPLFLSRNTDIFELSGCGLSKKSPDSSRVGVISCKIKSQFILNLLLDLICIISKKLLMFLFISIVCNY